MVRKAAAVVALVVGLFWIISPYAMHYPSKLSATDDITDAFRSSYSDAGIAQSTQDLQLATTFANDFLTKAVPALAARAGVTPAQFLADVGRQYPDIAAGVAVLPEALPYFQSLLDGVKRDQADFHQADNIPGVGLPRSSVHWFFVGNGVAALLFGGLALRGGGQGRTGVLLIGALGLVAVVGTLAFNETGKTLATERLQDHSRVVFTGPNAAKGQEYVAKLKAMDEQLRGEAIGGIAQQLGVSSIQLQLQLATTVPGLATGLTEFPKVLGRLDVLTAEIADNVRTFRSADALPTRSLAISWLPYQMIVPGAVLVVAGALGVVGARRPREEQPALA
jgi:hypothetical protein